MFTRFHLRLPWIAALPTPLRAGPLWARFLGAALLTVLSIDMAGATPNPIAGRIVSPSGLAVEPLSSLWDEHVLFAFTGAAPYGGLPDSPLIPDGKGNFFGATRSNGNNSGPCSNLCGTVFELFPSVAGPWRQRVLHTFTGADGT